MPNDFIITYSDGFADQFGGVNGKKFKYKQLQQLLIQLQGKPTKNIPGLLNGVFEKWKGKLDQVDDVLIIGLESIKITPVYPLKHHFHKPMYAI